MADVEVLCNAGTDLPRVTVNGLTAHQDHVGAAQVADCARKREGSCQRVGSRKRTIRHKVRVVNAQRHGFPQRLRGLRRAHGEGGQRPTVLLLQPHAFFDGVDVERIDD